MVMKRNKILAPLLFLLIAFAPIAKAQVDTLFWFAAPWISTSNANNIPVTLRIAAFNNLTTVRIQQPASTYDTTFTLAANSSFSKNLSHIITSIENQPANTILTKGLKISSDFPITVVYEIVTNGNNPETFSLKGQNGIGTEFITPFQTKWNNGSFVPAPKSMFCIVATQNNTTVSITPKAAIVGHVAGQTFSITLQKGESYTCENLVATTSSVGNNLSGSIIVSNKPICVTVSDDSVLNTLGGGCNDLMGDQLVPTDVIGKEYIVNKGAMTAASNEGVFVVASRNFTSIAVNNGITTTNVVLNKGDTWYYELTQALAYITADKPIYVLQASGFGCELSEALVPSLNCTGSDKVNFLRTNDSIFVLNVLCKAGDEGFFSLNGNTTLLTPASFTVVPGTLGQWMAAQRTFTTTEIPSNVTQLLTTTNASLFAVAMLNGSANSGSRFHYLSSFARKVYVNAGVDQNVCSGLGAVNLLGSITGGVSTGAWSALNGTGTLTTPTNIITSYLPSTNDITRGFVTFVLTSTGNCNAQTDTIIVNFKANPQVNAGTDITKCVNNIGAVSLIGTTINATGVNWSGGNGGTFANSTSLATTYTPSAADITAGVVSLALTTTSNAAGCPNVSDTLKLFINSAPLVNAGLDIVTCSNNFSVNLSGLVNGIASNGIWTTLGSGVISPNDTTLAGATYTFSNNDTTLGVVMIKLTSTNNGLCNAVEDTVKIIITNAPIVKIISADTVCASNMLINLNATVTAGFLFDWTTLGTGLFTSTTTASTTYNFSLLDTAAGQVTLVLATQPGLCSIVSDTLHLTLAKPSTAFAGADFSICSNGIVSLNGVVTGAASSGVWTSNGTGAFSPSSNQLITSYVPSLADAGTTVQFILIPTNTQGCTSNKDTLLISLHTLPNANFSANNVCINQAAVFSDASFAAPGATISSWLWKFGDNTQPSIAPSPIHNYLGFGVYLATLTVTDSYGCIDSIQQYLSVDPIPYPDFLFGTACQNNATAFNDLSTIPQGNIVSWQYNFGDQTPPVNQANTSHSFANSTSYLVTLTVVSDRGCSNSSTQNVTVLPKPTANFTIGSNPALTGESVMFADASTGTPVSWNWNFGDTTGTTIQNPSHIFESGGYYSVSLTVADIQGCIDTISMKIQIAMLPVLPTAFTPNGDLKNDTLFVRGGPFKSLVFKVYNNWGALIFQSNDQLQGWDGKFQNIEQPMGVYVWFVEAEVADGKMFKKSGDITLIR